MKLFSSNSEWQERGLLYVYESERGLDAFAKTDQMLEENFGVSANKIEWSSIG